MKMTEIQTGIAYSKRGVTAHWGVPVTTESLYSFPSNARLSNQYLYSGKGVLVIVNDWSPASGKSSTPEDAINALKRIKAPGAGSIKDLVVKLKKKGLGVEVWLPREFHGTFEDVQNERAAQRANEERIRAEQKAARSALIAQFEAVAKDLGVDARATVNTAEGKVTMSTDNWKKLMDRVEALLQSDPLNTGML